jgi:hypothetical protein
LAMHRLLLSFIFVPWRGKLATVHTRIPRRHLTGWTTLECWVLRLEILALRRSLLSRVLEFCLTW